MATVGNLIDRAFRDFLSVPGEQPPRAKLASNVADRLAGATFGFNIDMAMMSPEEQDLIAPGVVVEIDSELVLIESIVDTAVTARGGMFDTAAAAHNTGVYVTVLPEGQPSRKAVFDAVCESIDGLWPDLYGIKSTTLHAGTADPVELPYDCEAVVSVLAQSGFGWDRVGGWSLLSPFPMFASQRAIQFWPPVGSTVIVTYRARPQRPTSEFQQLPDLNVDVAWARLITVTAVADVISGVDVEAASAEFITSTLEREGFPVGAGTDLRNAMLTYADFLRQRRRRAIDASVDTPSHVVREF